MITHSVCVCCPTIGDKPWGTTPGAPTFYHVPATRVPKRRSGLKRLADRLRAIDSAIMLQLLPKTVFVDIHGVETAMKFPQFTRLNRTLDR